MQQLSGLNLLQLKTKRTVEENLLHEQMYFHFKIKALTSLWPASNLFNLWGANIRINCLQCFSIYFFSFQQTVLRIWDCLFYEGSKILFRVALTLIRHHEALIRQAQSLPDICQTFKQITTGPFVDDCHTFMQVKWTRADDPFCLERNGLLIAVFCVWQQIFTEPGSLPAATLTKLRASCRSRIIAEEAWPAN